MDYLKQAQDFATKHGVKLTILSQRWGKHFPDDKKKRAIFKCRLSRGKKSYTFDFGQSIAAGREEPTMYDILACLTKYDVGTFENFCGDFGYSVHDPEEKKKVGKIYRAVLKEFAGVERVFDGIIEELQEIN